MMSSGGEMDETASVDIVTTLADAERLPQPPLVVLERVQAFFDEHGLGAGEAVVRPVGEGRSNFTFLVERGEDRYVLRRPPRPPYPPSTHDVVREARLQLALAPLGVRVPRVLAVCEGESVLGVPFYVMAHVDGQVITETLPAPLDVDEQARRTLGLELVEVLAEIHAVSGDEPALAEFRRSGHYLERQLRRFAELWTVNATRSVPAVDEAARRLIEGLPRPVAPTVVHGDFRLGNMIVGSADPWHIVAAVDWEMGAIGDPRADLGYLLATYSEPGSAHSLVGGSAATRAVGFPSKQELAHHYAEATGAEPERLEWFVGFALWKAAIFCEAIYGRYVRGELAAGDDRSAIFEAGVPEMAEGALRALGS
jgi:aminoglycoside phosphotransferase (APT) family kinase protein